MGCSVLRLTVTPEKYEPEHAGRGCESIRARFRFGLYMPFGITFSRRDAVFPEVTTSS